MLKEFKDDDIPSLLSILDGTDAKFLLQFAGSRYNYPLNEEQLIGTMEADDYKMFKLVDDISGKFLGHCQLVRIDYKNKKATVGRVLLDPVLRGKGMGSKMISCLIAYSKEILGFKELNLRVYDFNKSAIKCYQGLGFKEVSRQSNYFDAVKESWTSITMALKLN